MDRLLLRQELVRDEGLRLEAYKDSVGLWTIGVGHLLGNAARMTQITKPEAYALLEADIAAAEMVLRGIAGPALLVEVGEVRYRALVNMAFNLGNRLGDFKHFLAAIAAGDWALAGQYMMESKWAGQVGARATRLHDMIVTGEDV